MSNVKAVKITGELPFTWLEGMSAQDTATVAQTFLSPTIGIKLTWGSVYRMQPNDFGGRTAIYPFEITGEEALSFGYIDELIRLIERAGGKVTSRSVRDLEAAC